MVFNPCSFCRISKRCLWPTKAWQYYMDRQLYLAEAEQLRKEAS